MSMAIHDQGAAPPAIWYADFDDPHAMALAQREAAIEYLSLGDRAYRSEVTLLDFGCLAIQCASDGAHVTRGVTRRDRTSLLFGNGPMEATVNGWQATRSGAVMLGPGAELRCHVPQPLSWIAYSVDTAQCHAWLDGAPLPGEGDFSIAGDLVAKAPALRHVAMELTALARRGSGALAQAPIGAAVQDSVHRALTQGLGREEANTRALRQRMRVVADADAYLDHRQGRAVYTQELVEALGVSARSLHTAFATVYGMAPHQFLQLRRLNLVHQALRSGAGDARLVKTVALDRQDRRAGPRLLASRPLRAAVQAAVRRDAERDAGAAGCAARPGLEKRRGLA